MTRSWPCATPSPTAWCSLWTAKVPPPSGPRGPLGSAPVRSGEAAPLPLGQNPPERPLRPRLPSSAVPHAGSGSGAAPGMLRVSDTDPVQLCGHDGPSTSQPFFVFVFFMISRKPQSVCFILSFCPPRASAAADLPVFFPPRKGEHRRLLWVS